MDTADGTIQALTERLAGAFGADARLEQDVCEAYIVQMARLAGEMKTLVRLSSLAKQAQEAGVGQGKTLSEVAATKHLSFLADALESADRAVSGAYEKEYRG